MHVHVYGDITCNRLVTASLEQRRCNAWRRNGLPGERANGGGNITRSRLDMLPLFDPFQKGRERGIGIGAEGVHHDAAHAVVAFDGVHH